MRRRRRPALQLRPSLLHLHSPLSPPISTLLQTDAATALLYSSARGRASCSPLPDGAASGQAPSSVSCFALPLPPPLLCFLLHHRCSPHASSSLEPKPLPPFHRHAAALLPLARSAPRRRSRHPTSTALKRRRRRRSPTPAGVLFPLSPSSPSLLSPPLSFLAFFLFARLG